MQNKFSMILFVSILVLGTAALTLFFRLSLVEQRLGALETVSVRTAPADTVIGVPLTAAIPPQTKDIEITISDQGFSPSGFQMGPKDTVNLSITNQGKTAHSFVIDETQTNTGAIEPGQTKTLTLDKQFDQPVELKYYSNIAGDSADTFKGTIMVF